MKTGPKLNLIKKIGGKRGWGWGGLGGLTYNSNCEVNTKMQLSTQCRACGTINISKYVNIF